jgi:hypothetical protein
MIIQVPAPARAHIMPVRQRRRGEAGSAAVAAAAVPECVQRGVLPAFKCCLHHAASLGSNTRRCTADEGVV